MIDKQAHTDGVQSEEAVRQRAWLVAQRTQKHQVVIQRGKAIFYHPLVDVRIQRGDTLLALVSPHGEAQS